VTDPIRSKSDLICAGAIFRNGTRISFESLVEDFKEAQRIERKRKTREADKALSVMIGLLKETS
jgi:hypothetical protein